MLGELGSETDGVIDKVTDVVIRGDRADKGVKEDADTWSMLIIGVEEVKNSNMM